MAAQPNPLSRILLPVLALGMGAVVCSPAHAQPSDPAAWTKAPGPEGGWVQSLLADGTDLYAGMGESGVFRLPGGAGRWEPVQQGLASRAVAGLAVSPEGMLVAAGNAVYRLAADGKTWTPLPSYPGQAAYSLHAEDSLVLVGIDSGVVRSKDGGRTWSIARAGEYPYLWCFARLGRHLFAGSENSGGIFRSSDSGRTWNVVANGLPLSEGIAVYQVLGHDSRVFAASTQGLWVSADSGGTWNRVQGALPEDAQFTALAQYGQTLYAGTQSGKLYRSEDGGVGWQQVADPLGGGAIGAILVTAAHQWIGTREGGMQRRAVEGGAWSHQNGGLMGVAAQRLACAGPLRAAIWMDRLYLSKDAGATWHAPLPLEEQESPRGLAFAGDRLYLGDANALSELDPLAATPALRTLWRADVDGVVSLGGTLYFHSSESGLQSWDPTRNAPAGMGAIVPGAPLDAGQGAIRGYGRTGIFWEYRVGGGMKQFRAPELEVQSLGDLGGSAIAVTEGDYAAYVLDSEGDTTRATRLPLPFPVTAFCRDGEKSFAATAGDGIAAYVGQATSVFRTVRAARSRPRAPAFRGYPLFPDRNGHLRDALGKTRIR